MRRRLFCLLVLLALTIVFSIRTYPDPAASRRDFLSSERNNLVLEVSSAGLRRPSVTALSYLRRQLLRYCHKKTVTVLVEDPAPLDPLHISTMWPDFVVTERVLEGQKLHSTGDMAVMHIIYVDTFDIKAPSHAGLTISDDTFIIFRMAFSSEAEERNVLLHEAGHVLGLVGRTAPVLGDHHDPQRGVHCGDVSCVMFPTILSADADNLSPDFCDLCHREIIANGGR